MDIRRVIYKYDCPNCDNPMYSTATQIGGEEWVVEVAFVLGNEFECDRCGCTIYIPDDIEILNEWDDDWDKEEEEEIDENY